MFEKAQEFQVVAPPEALAQSAWRNAARQLESAQAKPARVRPAASRRTCRRSGSHPNCHCHNERSATILLGEL